MATTSTVKDSTKRSGDPFTRVYDSFAAIGHRIDEPILSGVGRIPGSQHAIHWTSVFNKQITNCSGNPSEIINTWSGAIAFLGYILGFFKRFREIGPQSTFAVSIMLSISMYTLLMASRSLFSGLRPVKTDCVILGSGIFGSLLLTYLWACLGHCDGYFVMHPILVDFFDRAARMGINSEEFSMKSATVVPKADASIAEDIDAEPAPIPVSAEATSQAPGTPEEIFSIHRERVFTVLMLFCNTVRNLFKIWIPCPLISIMLDINDAAQHQYEPKHILSALLLCYAVDIVLENITLLSMHQRSRNKIAHIDKLKKDKNVLEQDAKDRREIDFQDELNKATQAKFYLDLEEKLSEATKECTALRAQIQFNRCDTSQWKQNKEGQLQRLHREVAALKKLNHGFAERETRLGQRNAELLIQLEGPASNQTAIIQRNVDLQNEVQLSKQKEAKTASQLRKAVNESWSHKKGIEELRQSVQELRVSQEQYTTLATGYCMEIASLKQELIYANMDREHFFKTKTADDKKLESEMKVRQSLATELKEATTKLQGQVQAKELYMNMCRTGEEKLAASAQANNLLRFQLGLMEIEERNRVASSVDDSRVSEEASTSSSQEDEAVATGESAGAADKKESAGEIRTTDVEGSALEEVELESDEDYDFVESDFDGDRGD